MKIMNIIDDKVDRSIYCHSCSNKGLTLIIGRLLADKAGNQKVEHSVPSSDIDGNAVMLDTTIPQCAPCPDCQLGTKNRVYLDKQGLNPYRWNTGDIYADGRVIAVNESSVNRCAIRGCKRIAQSLSRHKCRECYEFGEHRTTGRKLETNNILSLAAV